ncbi:hypothetical protein T459_21406 [Capsicum annuum]|uniref:Ubiquitin-like protease family profile domain-containing protein n=1 Tax=Capsicum annuum TaxID=4072 RepID=A0A2G2YWL4_CAPAN|nr:hypothetical protein FXO37_21052 [Capsicum annuum]PHT74129.1 hypothetical protein T459_21406 [Capsicum annuum]
MTSKRSVIPSKRISYPDTPLEIKAAKKTRKDTFKALSIIKKVDVTATVEEHNMTVDNPSTASKHEEKVKPVSLGERKNYPFEAHRCHFLLPPKEGQVANTRTIQVRTDWSTMEAYRDKMDNPFDVQYVDGISHQTIGSLDCAPFIAAYFEYSSDGLQVPYDGLDAGLLRKRYAAFLWKYREAKAQKPYATDVKDPR